MKNILTITIIFLNCLSTYDINAQVKSSVFENNSYVASFGVFGNNGLGPGLPLSIGFEKYFPFSKRTVVGVSQEISYVNSSKKKTTYYVSSQKFNLHMQFVNNLDIYLGGAFNYMLIDEGAGAEYFDQFLGYQIGVKYYFDKDGKFGLYTETGKGNYLNFGLSIGIN
jgi:hypothetical protein